MTEFKVPTTTKQVRQFLGLSGYHRHFVQDYACHAEQLFALTKKDVQFHWDDKCQAAGKKYVVSCCSCQATKPSQRKTAGLMVPIQPQRPWEYAGVDYVGPLPRTQRGNAYILVFVDYFSKWIEVRAARWHGG